MPITSEFYNSVFGGEDHIAIYQHEGRIGLTGNESDGWKQIHLRQGMYTYKYETHGNRPENPQIYYISKTRYNLFRQVKSTSDYYKTFIKDIEGTVAIISHKIIGLFQSFEWSVYRTTDSLNYLHPVFWFGLVHFFFFVSICFEVFRIIGFNRNIFFSTSTPLQIFCILHTLFYAILTVPESRFIAPVIPAIIANGVILTERPANSFRSTTIAVFSLILYFWNFKLLSHALGVIK